MIKYLFLILTLSPLFAIAQEKNDSKYLAGAVPEVNGKVLFSKELNAPQFSQAQIYDAILSWAQKRFFTNEEDNWGLVLLADKEKGQIVCNGGEYLVFTDKLLSLDRAKTGYRLNIFCSAGKCKVEMTGIYYFYPESSRERINAEDWITDEYALNKKKDKLAFRLGKFRTKTIDLFESHVSDIQKAIGASALASTPAAQQPVTAAQPVVVPQQEIAPAQTDQPTQPSTLAGYKQISPDKIPGNIIKMLSEDWMLITASNGEKFNPMTASWGGLGYLYNRPVAFCFINPSRYTYTIMEEGDTYTLSFYTETYREALKYCGSHSGKDGDKVKAAGLTPITTPSGSKAFSEAWMIIECKKLVAQPLQQGAIHDANLRHEWDGKKMHQMYIGEIINIWVK